MKNSRPSDDGECVVGVDLDATARLADGIVDAWVRGGEGDSGSHRQTTRRAQGWAGAGADCGGRLAGPSRRMSLALGTSVLGLPLVHYAASDLGPAVGAACFGLVAAGAGLDETCPPVADLIEPDAGLADAYRPRIAAWRGLYRSLRPLFRSAQPRGDAG